jgi:hypothetical protein
VHRRHPRRLLLTRPGPAPSRRNAGRASRF